MWMDKAARSKLTGVEPPIEVFAHAVMCPVDKRAIWGRRASQGESTRQGANKKQRGESRLPSCPKMAMEML